MAESVQTTLEEAGRCPTCNSAGVVSATIVAPGMPAGTKLLTYMCKSALCPDSGGVWLVQVNPDGSIPPKRDHTGEKKLYVGFDEDTAQAQRIRDMIEMERQLSRRPDGHGEINR